MCTRTHVVCQNSCVRELMLCARTHVYENSCCVPELMCTRTRVVCQNSCVRELMLCARTHVYENSCCVGELMLCARTHVVYQNSCYVPELMLWCRTRMIQTLIPDLWFRDNFKAIPNTDVITQWSDNMSEHQVCSAARHYQPIVMCNIRKPNTSNTKWAMASTPVINSHCIVPEIEWRHHV